jgi:hypothetical protein
MKHKNQRKILKIQTPILLYIDGSFDGLCVGSTIILFTSIYTAQMNGVGSLQKEKVYFNEIFIEAASLPKTEKKKGKMT